MPASRAARPTAAILALLLLLGGIVAVTPTSPAAADANEAPARPFAYRSIAAGDSHTCAIIHDATVKCWGLNTHGQLGLGDTVTRGDDPGEMGDDLPAVDIGTGRTATALTAGGTHTCALLDTGTVRCWGRNNKGQLGIGDTANRGDAAGEMGDNLPLVNLGTGRTATAIAAAGSHTCALLDNATIKCWGDNLAGQLGLGDTLARGDAAGEMGNSLPAVNLGTGRTATAVAAGNSHTCAVLDNGSFKCWGLNTSGELGLGDTASRGDSAAEMGDNLPAVSLGTGRTATAVAVGNGHSCALLDNASVKCWGSNTDGQLGRGNTVNRGDLANQMGDNLAAIPLGSGRTPISITTGGTHTCAVLDNATVKCWGNGAGGRLGLGDSADRGVLAAQMGNSLPAVNLGTGRTATAVTTGNGHTCAVLDDRSVKCWGSNTNGQLGQGDTASRGDASGEMGDSLLAIPLSTSRTATSVTAGNLHSCALLDNARVKCWGLNDNGRLGLGDTANRGDAAGEMGNALPTVSLGSGRTATAISAGNAHTCALLDNGTVKCWGLGTLGRLGLGDTTARGDAAGEMGNSLPAVSLGTGRTATAIAAGVAHTCALLDNGSVKCWGQNTSGQLGLGDTANRGDAAGEMGDSLPAVSLGSGRTATAIAVGNSFSCARLDDATVKCWGSNADGRLGVGDTANRGDAAGEMGDSLPTVNLGTGRTATAVTAGLGHACAVLDDATVKCWGLGNGGRLGQGDQVSRGDGPGEMGDALPAVSLGTGRTVLSASAGDFQTCVRLDDGSVKCWGQNVGGALGIGDVSSRGDGAGEMGDDLEAVSLGSGRTAARVSAATSSACVVLDNGRVKCWGLNNSGRLGLGDTANRGDAGGEMGNTLLPVDLGAGAATGLSGTVTDAVSGAPLAGTFVAVLRTTDFAFTAGVVADSLGNFRALVPPSTYFLYLIDRTGAHEIGFGPGNPVAGVTRDTVVDIDTSMTPTRGTIAGTITADGPGTPIAGAFAVTLDGQTGNAETAAPANGAGVFSLPGLRASTHFVAYLDPTGAHAPEFFPNSPTVVPGATALSVSAGGTTVADDALAPQSPVPGGSSLTGVVNEQGTGTPLANVLVIALQAADFGFARSTVTDGTGHYTLNVEAGGYKLAFVDTTALHPMEWHLNQPNTGLAAALTVTAPTATNATLARATGSLSGTVTDSGSTNALPGVWVFAIGPTGISGGAVTAGNGSYTITGLAPGTYRVEFVDAPGGRTPEYFDNALDFAGATTRNVTAGVNTANVNGALALP